MNDTAESVCRARLARAAAGMEAAGVDALVLTPGADLFYLSGFEHGHAGERLLALVVRRDGSSGWIAPAMNVPQIAPHALAGQSVRGWRDGEGYHPAVRAAMAGAKAIAFDDEARAGFLLDLMDAAPAATFRKASQVMRDLRIRKDGSELAALRAAGRTVDEVIGDARGLCRPGRTERQVDRDLRARLIERTPRGEVGFAIVAAGPNSALPHHEASDRAIEAGDLVVLDYGTRLDGYRSDITVMCAVGEPADPEARRVYEVVWQAQQAALAAVRPGVLCGDVDLAARDVIDAAGYGEYFVHRTGHGLGLQVHEPPYLVAGSDERLEAGMVFSIEPGIYLPGRFGVRLEVIAAVGPGGAELLNRPSDRELPVMALPG